MKHWQYHFNGLGHLVGQTWTVKKNGYGYTNVNDITGLYSFEDFMAEYGDEAMGYVTDVIDTINSSSSTHGGFGGGTIPLIPETTEIGEQTLVIAIDPDAIPGEGMVIFRMPTELITVYGNGNLNQTTQIVKTFTLDYTSPLANVIMETESVGGDLTYRYVYGLNRISVSVSPITNGAGSIAQNGSIKLWYHRDRLGSADYLTDNVQGKVTSYTTYDSWGEPTMKAILKIGQRQLDLITEYTGHPYDPVLGIYYARARMYDAADRRFMAVDPVKGTILAVQSLGQYSYVLNNPVKYIDPWGLAASASDVGSNLTLNVLAYTYARGSQDIYSSSQMVLQVATLGTITTGNWFTIAHRVAQVVLAGRLWRKGFGFILEKQLYDNETESYVYADIVAFRPDEGIYFLLELKNLAEARYRPEEGRKQLYRYFQLLSCRHPNKVAYFPQGVVSTIHQDILLTEYYILGIRFEDRGGGLFGYQYTVRFHDDNARRKFNSQYSFNFQRQAFDLETYEQFKHLVQWRAFDYQRALKDSAVKEIYSKYNIDPVMYDINQMYYIDRLHTAAVMSAVIGTQCILLTAGAMFDYTILVAGVGAASIPSTGDAVTIITVISPEILKLIEMGLNL